MEAVLEYYVYSSIYLNYKFMADITVFKSITSKFHLNYNHTFLNKEKSFNITA